MHKKILPLLIVIMVLLSSCSQDENISLFLGSTLSLDLHAGDEGLFGNRVKKCESEIKEFLKEFELAVSVNIEDSEISKFNRAEKGERVSLSFHVLKVFKRAAEIYDISEGAFNPFMNDISALWGFDSDGDIYISIPTEEQIAPLLERIAADSSSDLITFEDNAVYKLREGIKADLGAIAKGYAAGVCREIAAKHNIAYGTINIAGNIYAINRFKGNGEDRQYKIAVTDPRALQNNNNYFGKLQIEDTSVSVSGDYERYFIKDGKRYCHIMGMDGKPVHNGVISVIIVGKDGADADAFATAAMVLGKDKGFEFLEEQSASGIIIYSEGEGFFYRTCGEILLSEVFKGYTYVG